MPPQTVTHDVQPEGDAHWLDVCAFDDIYPASGVAALILGEQVALIRTRHDKVYAISNFDPFSKAFVLARGIVGSKGAIPKVASPIYKQSFNLETGECLDDPNVKLPVYPVRVSGGRVKVGVHALSAPGRTR
jgi:nitrite reductase (NADH) small subunit